MNLFKINLFVLLTLTSTFTFAENLDLSISDTVVEVKTNILEDAEFTYVRYRAVLEVWDIYPQLNIEVFQKGEEGDPTQVKATINVIPGTKTISDAQVENLEWDNRTLRFKYNGKSCFFEVSQNLTGSMALDPICN